jgi:hypothetical protein
MMMRRKWWKGGGEWRRLLLIDGAGRDGFRIDAAAVTGKEGGGLSRKGRGRSAPSAKNVKRGKKA